LYCSDQCDDSTTDQFLQDLPNILEDERIKLDQPLTFSEVSQAVQESLGKLSLGKSPGLDGLTVEFFKSFWKLMGQDLSCWHALMEGFCL